MEDIARRHQSTPEEKKRLGASKPQKLGPVVRTEHQDFLGAR
jgi:hypothetical protein